MLQWNTRKETQAGTDTMQMCHQSGMYAPCDAKNRTQRCEPANALLRFSPSIIADLTVTIMKEKIKKNA